MRWRAGSLVVLWALTAAAQGEQEPARLIYDRGAQAYDRGDYTAAAADFARADALAPNEVALTQALKAVLGAGDPVLGMTLVERARARNQARELARRAERRFRARVGRLVVSCATSCRIRVDGRVAEPDASLYALPGQYVVEASFESGTRRELVSLQAGGEQRLELLEPPPPRPAPEEQKPSTSPAAPPELEPSGGLSPAWFWLGAGLSVAAAGATIASGIDTLAKNDEFRENPDPERRQAGLDAQQRTNILLAVTAGLAASSAVLGLFVVRWSESGAAQASVVPGGALLTTRWTY